MSTKGLFIDEEFNIQFVQEVKKYPCLYDNTLKEYSIRSEQDKAWDQVARVYGSTGADCKKKWKILRGGLTRYIKHGMGKSGDSTTSKKKYYLWDAMQFVLPFTNARRQSGNLIIKNEDENEDSSMDDNEEDSRVDDNDEASRCGEPENNVPDFPLPVVDVAIATPSAINRQYQPKLEVDELEGSREPEENTPKSPLSVDLVHTTYSATKRKYQPKHQVDELDRPGEAEENTTELSLSVDVANTVLPATKRKCQPKHQVDELESAILGYLSQRKKPKPENPDLDFFKSILPDVSALNPSKKRKFKLLILQTLESLLSESDPLTTAVDRPASNSSPTYSSDTASSNMANFVTNNYPGHFLVNSPEIKTEPIYEPNLHP